MSSYPQVSSSSKNTHSIFKSAPPQKSSTPLFKSPSSSKPTPKFNVNDSESSSSSEELLASKIKSLQQMSGEASKNIDKKEKCFPTLLAIGVIAPFVIWAAFHFIKPSFVQKQADDGSYVRDTKKVFTWTFIVSIVLWICLYLWTYCKGYDKAAFLCSKK